MDRFFKGIISGMTGGFIMNLWSFLTKDLLHIANRNFVDWAAVIIYGYLPTNWYEFLLAFVTHLLWAGFVGLLFTYFSSNLTSQGFLIKGAYFGFIVGFFLYASAILLRMPFFSRIPFPLAVSQSIGGTIWGITTAQMLSWFNAKYE